VGLDVQTRLPLQGVGRLMRMTNCFYQRQPSMARMALPRPPTSACPGTWTARQQGGRCSSD
jgi:hypothetical protein